MFDKLASGFLGGVVSLTGGDTSTPDLDSLSLFDHYNRSAHVLQLSAEDLPSTPLAERVHSTQSGYPAELNQEAEVQLVSLTPRDDLLKQELERMRADMLRADNLRHLLAPPPLEIPRPQLPQDAVEITSGKLHLLFLKRFENEGGSWDPFTSKQAVQRFNDVIDKVEAVLGPIKGGIYAGFAFNEKAELDQNTGERKPLHHFEARCEDNGDWNIAISPDFLESDTLAVLYMARHQIRTMENSPPDWMKNPLINLCFTGEEPHPSILPSLARFGGMLSVGRDGVVEFPESAQELEQGDRDLWEMTCKVALMRHMMFVENKSLAEVVATDSADYPDPDTVTRGIFSAIKKESSELRDKLRGAISREGGENGGDPAPLPPDQK